MSAHTPTGPNGASFLRTVRAVAWSFLGIRKNSEFRDDMGRLNPVHIIIVAVLGAVLFVGALVLLVNWVVR